MKGWLRRRCFGTKPLGERRSGLVCTTWSMLLRERRFSRSFAGGGGRDEDFELRVARLSMGGRGFSELDSGRRGRSGAPRLFSIIIISNGEYLPCKLSRFNVLPRLFGVSPSCGVGEGRPSSSSSRIVGASLSRRLLAALKRRKLFTSASFSFRLRSLLFALRSSFSSSNAHQPANESHRCASTFSIIMSISTPAARIRCSTSFSNSVENGGGC
jgi:hypothetical protein